MPQDFSEEKNLEQLDAMAADLDALATLGNLESLTFNIKHFDASANFSVTGVFDIDFIATAEASATFAVTSSFRNSVTRETSASANMSVTAGGVEAVRLKYMTPASASFSVTDNFYFTRNLGTSASMNGIVNATAECTGIFSMAADVTGVLTTTASAVFLVYIYPDAADVTVTATAAEPVRLNYIEPASAGISVTATAVCSIEADMPADSGNAILTSAADCLRIKHFTVDENLSMVATTPVLAKLGEEWTVIATQSANFTGNPANNQTWFIQ